MATLFNPSLVAGSRPEVGLVARCGICNLFKNCLSPKMKPFGEGRKKVLLVGEAPGKNEDREGRPFVGKAGGYLRDVLDSIGVDLDEDCLTTNSITCRPEDNATPTPKQIAWCRPNLTNTIRDFDPDVVITLGRPALTSVLGQKWKSISALEPWVGWTIPNPDYWICPTYHPSYLLRSQDPTLDRLFSQHLAAAFALSGKPDPLPNFKKLVKIAYDAQEVLGAIEGMGKVVALDYETNAAKPCYSASKVHSCALSDGRTTVSYPWHRETRKVTGDLLFNPRIKKVAYNMKFEEGWTLKEFGRGVEGWDWDGMLAAHCLDNRSGICSLKFQSFVRLGVPLYNKEIEPYLEAHNGHYNRINQADQNALLFYGGMDVYQEFQLAKLQKAEL